MSKEIIEINKESIKEFGLKHFATESYVDKLIENKRWHKDGSSFSDCQEFFECFKSEFPNAEKDKKVLKKLLLHWLPIRIGYIAEQIDSEIIKGTGKLYRAAPIPTSVFKAAQKNTDYPMPLEISGEEWSIREDTDEYSANMDFNEPVTVVTMMTNLELDNIDWYKTLSTRIDFVCGDYDLEYCLKPESVISIKSVKVF